MIMALSKDMGSAARMIRSRKAELARELIAVREAQNGSGYGTDQARAAELEAMIRGLTEAESFMLSAALGVD
jgi:hypothetical protein